MESRLLFQFYAQGTERTEHIFRRPHPRRCRVFFLSFDTLCIWVIHSESTHNTGTYLSTYLQLRSIYL